MKRLVSAFIGLNILDIALTLYLTISGEGTELNPIAGKMLSQPLSAILAYKVALPLIMGLGLYLLHRHHITKFFNPANVLRLAVIGLIAVCLFNIGGVFLGALIQ